MSLVHRAIPALLAAGLVLPACTTASPPPATPAPAAPAAPVTAAPEPEPTPESEPPPSAPPPSASEAPPPAVAYAEEVNAACTKLCAQAAEQCSAKSARKCRANCERYESLAERCGEAALSAVRCQAATPGLVCSNVVGQCAPEFQKLSACESGQTVAERPNEAASARAALPTGWVELKDDVAGFSVGLPKLVEAQTEQGNRTWRVQDEQGVTVVVAVLPPFEAEVTDKTLVRKVLVILGQQCQRGMKIHGRFQSGGNESARFDSQCSNGDSWHGMLRISARHVIMTAEIVPPGKVASGDAFYYSFGYR
jgi:hypothetical protein